MDMPRPGPAHERLMRFVGRWSGREQMLPSPFGPGGSAIGRTVCRSALDGLALIQEYHQEKDGQVVFHGHGVMQIEPGSDAVLWWWFDSMGFPPEPARGVWDGDVLLFEKALPHGAARYRYEFAGDRYRFVIENRMTPTDGSGDDGFTEFMHGDYTRAD